MYLCLKSIFTTTPFGYSLFKREIAVLCTLLSALCYLYSVYSKAHKPSLVKAKRPTEAPRYSTSTCFMLFILFASFTYYIMFVNDIIERLILFLHKQRLKIGQRVQGKCYLQKPAQRDFPGLFKPAVCSKLELGSCRKPFLRQVKFQAACFHSRSNTQCHTAGIFHINK